MTYLTYILCCFNKLHLLKWPHNRSGRDFWSLPSISQPPVYQGSPAVRKCRNSGNQFWSSVAKQYSFFTLTNWLSIFMQLTSAVGRSPPKWQPHNRRTELSLMGSLFGKWFLKGFLGDGFFSGGTHDRFPVWFSRKKNILLVVREGSFAVLIIIHVYSK